MPAPITDISFGELKGLRLHSDTLMDRVTGKNILDDQHLKNCIKDILTTPLGTRVMLREYGCDLFRLIDRPINRDLIAEMYAVIHKALHKWEPRLLVTKLNMDASDWQHGKIVIGLEGHYLLENGPIRISDLSLDFMAQNQFHVEDPDAYDLQYGVQTFRDLAAASDGQFVFAADGDNGEANSVQTAKAALMATWNPDAYLMAGDLNYELGQATTIMANTAAFNDPIGRGIVFPAIGNHDYQTSVHPSNVTPYASRYGYLPGNRRYYKVEFFGGLVTLLTIATGYSTGGVTVEPDGNLVGSIQHQWLLDELAKCQSPYVILMGHHPFASKVSSGGTVVKPDLAWIKSLPKVQLYLHGHTHCSQHNVYAPEGQLKLHCLDVSAGVSSSRSVSGSGTMHGDSTGMQNVWAYAADGAIGPPTVARFTVTERLMTVEVFNVTTGALMHTFPIHPWI